MVGILSRQALVLFAGAILLAAVAAGWIGAERFLQAHPGADVFDLHFGFGPLVESLVERGEYAVEDGGLTLRAHRLPLIPCMLALLASISTSIHFIYLAKNLVLAALLISVLPALGRITGGSSLRVLLCLLTAFALPYNANKFAAVEIQEGYLGHLFFAWFVLFADSLQRERPNSAWGMAVLLAAAAMTKASMLASTVTAGLLALFQFKRPQLRWAPLLGVVVSMLCWAGFTWSTTGRPALLREMSSWSGWAGYKGNNPYTIDYYPQIDLDMLDQEGKLLLAKPVADEWEQHDRYIDLT